MSFSNILKSISVIALGSLVGYSTVKFLSQPNENNRGIASITYSKLGSEQYAKSLFEIKIQNGTLAEKIDELSEIVVSVEALKTLPEGLVYSWSIPDTATVIEGDMNGSLAGFSAHEKKEYRLKVKGYSREVRHFISFTIKGNLNSKPVNRDVLISSRPEDSFEYVVREREKERAIEKKLVNKMGKTEAKSPIDLNKVSF